MVVQIISKYPRIKLVTCSLINIVSVKDVFDLGHLMLVSINQKVPVWRANILLTQKYIRFFQNGVA